ncbi:hypothetical protein [Alkalimarinus coralli]|uniref:hypothetical protein n=1 Tax=Alkalimarinus coralli TaxID=2935863 RepID=UPI00202AFC23|nr:hypothetical protein [Alkalimarinus coralli]
MKTQHFLILVGVGVAGAWYMKNKTVEAVGDVAEAINPVNQENIFYGVANAITQKLTGDEHDTFGTWLYDFFNPNQEF